MPGGITIKESEEIYMNEVQILEASKKDQIPEEELLVLTQDQYK